MTRDLSELTKKDLKRILKKQGMREDTYINYNPKSRGERISLEVGIVTQVNKVLGKHGLIMVMQGMDRENYYLFRIVKK